MSTIVITSGPTRQYLDPVRYLTNASSGRMGCALAESALELGHDVTVISGPVQLDYPKSCRVVSVISTKEMLDATRLAFETADGLIGAAAPCDYMPQYVSSQKLSKTGSVVHLELIETPDIVATLGNAKRPNQWVVGFALETEDHRFRALIKLQRKCCDLMVSNDPSAIDSLTNHVDILDRSGIVLETLGGDKKSVAQGIMRQIQVHLIQTK